MLDLSANQNKLGGELASHGLLSPDMAQNQILTGALGRQLHSTLSKIDPQTEAGVRALQNLKNTIDANQFGSN